ncbi:MAG: Base plate wedge protein 53 [Pseudomonadota bacterium]
MTDPVQLLIDAGAIPAQPFDAASRYVNTGIALLAQPFDAPPIAYVKRRFIAQRRDIAIAAAVVISAGDRPDLLAARTLGEPLLYWRVADANAVTDAAELTATPGARVLIPAG